MQRLFIAFPIPREAAQEVERVQLKLEDQNQHAPITWTRIKPHCTVVFLGDCDDTTMALLKERLPALAGSGAIQALLGALDAFPNLRRPRVLIVHIDDLTRGISGLYERVQMILDPIAPRGAMLHDDRKKPFTPHITLGRVKQDGTRVRGTDTITIAPIAFEVTKVVLFASELLPNGPRHTALLSVSFRPSPDKSGRVEKSN